MSIRTIKRTGLFAIAIILIMSSTGCAGLWGSGRKEASPRTASPAVSSATGPRVYQFPYAKVFDQARRILDAFDWQVVSSDESKGTMEAFPGLHFLMWGKKFEVKVERLDENSARVTAEYGRNQGENAEKVQAFYRELDVRISALQAASSPAAAAKSSENPRQTPSAAAVKMNPALTSTEAKETLSVDKSARDAAFKNGRSLFAEKDYAGAAEHFNRAFRIDPAFSEAIFNAATCYFYLEDYKRAEEAFGFFLTLEPKDAGGYYFRGICRFKQGDVDGAAADWKETLRLDPNHASAKKNLEALGAL